MAVISDFGPDDRRPPDGLDPLTCLPELRGHPHEHALWCEPGADPCPDCSGPKSRDHARCTRCEYAWRQLMRSFR